MRVPTIPGARRASGRFRDHLTDQRAYARRARNGHACDGQGLPHGSCAMARGQAKGLTLDLRSCSETLGSLHCVRRFSIVQEGRADTQQAFPHRGAENWIGSDELTNASRRQQQKGTARRTCMSNSHHGATLRVAHELKCTRQIIRAVS